MIPLCVPGLLLVRRLLRRRSRLGPWRYRPALVPLPELTLAGSGFGGAYHLCVAGDCRPLAHWLAGQGVAAAPLRIRACADAAKLAARYATTGGTPRPIALRIVKSM